MPDAFFPHIWHKKFIELPIDLEHATGETGAYLTSTACPGTVFGLVMQPWVIVKQPRTYWTAPVPTDWDGTSKMNLRLTWAQYPAGNFKDGTYNLRLLYWVAQDWDTMHGTKSVELSATMFIGDEGTTSYCMHCGTFEIDLTSGTFGTVSVGHTLYMNFMQAINGAPGPLGTIALLRAQLEYMAGYVGPTAIKYSTQDKRGS